MGLSAFVKMETKIFSLKIPFRFLVYQLRSINIVLKDNAMEIPVRKLFLLLLFIVFILLAMHFFPESLSSTIHNRFNLDGEANVPTWYSTVLLFSVALSSLIIYHLDNISSYADKSWRLFWLGFGGVYCFFSLDEAARLHEIIDVNTSIKWIFIYAPLVGIFFVVCAYYLAVRNNNKTLRNWIIGGLIIYAAGGLFAEFVSYLFYPLPPALQQVEFVLEEGLELIGTILVLMGCLQESNRLYGIVHKHNLRKM